MATAIQIKLIHTAKTKLNIDEETYREILAGYNVSSSKEMDIYQADELITYFKNKGFKIKRTPHKATMGGKIIKIATKHQYDLIDALKSNITWNVSYEAWLKGRMKINKIITTKDAQKVIEGLKGMLGINTHDIEFLNLPLPINLTNAHTDAFPNTNGWFYDTKNHRLIQLKNGEIWQTIGR